MLYLLSIPIRPVDFRGDRMTYDKPVIDYRDARSESTFMRCYMYTATV